MGWLALLLLCASSLGVLWLLGVVSSYTMGGFIHLLLVLALIALLFQLSTARRTAL